MCVGGVTGWLCDGGLVCIGLNHSCVWGNLLDSPSRQGCWSRVTTDWIPGLGKAESYALQLGVAVVWTPQLVRITDSAQWLTGLSTGYSSWTN